MIRYSLKCAAGHDFESWFANAPAFDALKASGALACPICGDSTVEKALMAPSVRSARKAEAQREAAAQLPSPSAEKTGPLSAPAHPMEQAIAELKRQIEKNSEYVGMNFAAEARKMHEGDAPERAIHGEAKPEEARQLIEDGVPVMPLPFLPGSKTN